jgi:hypothetical protein
MGALLGPFVAASSIPTTLVPVSDRAPIAPELPSSPLGAGGYLPKAEAVSPELAAPAPQAQEPAALPNGPHGIPGVVLRAYQLAQQSVAASDPTCGLSWPVLAGVGRIESNHARGGRLDANGTTVKPILGPQLSGGPGVAAIRDTDDGRLDGDPVWDRAVGPMQFIPSTWVNYQSDGNNDGIASPHNMYDAALDAARYLCAGNGDLRDPAQLASAIFRYNHSNDYVRTVLRWARAYSGGVTPLPAPTEDSSDEAVQAMGPPPAEQHHTTPAQNPSPPSTGEEGCGCQDNPIQIPLPPPAPPGDPLLAAAVDLRVLPQGEDGLDPATLLALGVGVDVNLGPLNLSVGIGLRIGTP